MHGQWAFITIRKEFLSNILIVYIASLQLARARNAFCSKHYLHSREAYKLVVNDSVNIHSQSIATLPKGLHKMAINIWNKIELRQKRERRLHQPGRCMGYSNGPWIMPRQLACRAALCKVVCCKQRNISIWYSRGFVPGPVSFWRAAASAS